MSAHAAHAAPTGPASRPGNAAALRHVLVLLITPLLMCVGMGFAYLGAFGDPQPHDLRVDVVGTGQSAQVLAQRLDDAGDGALDVRTVPTEAEARQRLTGRATAGAYVPGEHPELIVASAASETDATVVRKVFTEVAAGQGAPLTVTDVAEPASGDSTGQGIFFLLVAVSIGSYASVAVIGGVGAVLPMRIRALLGIGMSLVVSLIGAAFAGPVFHIVDQGLAGMWGLAWLYAAGVLLIGIGLHTFLKRWTTLGVMVLFVMLNFTSSGGLFEPELQPGFFGALHAFWNGAGFVEGTRSVVYFDGDQLGGNLLTLFGWALAGVVLVAVAAAAETRRRRAAGAVAAGAPVVPAAAGGPVTRAGDEDGGAVRAGHDARDGAARDAGEEAARDAREEAARDAGEKAARDAREEAARDAREEAEQEAEEAVGV